jgi:hypothetical protein
MPDTIKDGKGRGYLTEVSSENKLVTKATTETHLMHHTLDHENAFVAHFEHNQIADATDEIAGYIKYSGNNYLMISKIVMASNSAGECLVEYFTGSTGLSGGNAITPKNLNLGSIVDLATVTAKDTNKGTSAITTTSNGDEIFSYRIGWHAMPTYTHDFDDGLALRNGSILLFNTNQALAGDKLRISVYYFEEPAR